MQSPHHDNKSSNESASSSETSSRIPKVEGDRLRYGRDEICLLERDNMNLKLYINHLEQKIKLVKSGDGYYVEDVLRELRELHYELKDGRKTIQEQALRIYEDALEIERLKQRLQSREASDKTQTRSEAEITIEKLQKVVNGIAREKQVLVDEVEDLSRQNMKLSEDLNAQGESMAALKLDHERAMDTIYDLEARVMQYANQKSEGASEIQGTAQTDEDVLVVGIPEVEAIRTKLTSWRVYSQGKMRREINLNTEVASTLKMKMAERKKEVRRVVRDIQTLIEKKNLCVKEYGDFDSLQQSNRLLYEEVQVQSQQVKRATREINEMREAIEIYKEAIAERDSEIQKYSQRVHDRAPNKELEKTLLRQLQETKAMVAVVSERLENSPIGHENTVPSNQLIEYTHQMESAARHWSGFLDQVHEMQQQLEANISRCPNQPTNQPQWLQVINEQTSSLIAESALFSKTVHDILRNLAELPHQFACGDNFKISNSFRHSLKALHGKRVSVLGKKLEELEKSLCKRRSTTI